MQKTKMHDLKELGQSIWLDYIRRSFLQDGGLEAYVEKGLGGVTSNPSLFDTAISEGEEYDPAIAELSAAGKTTREIYEALVVEDIKQACDILHPVFVESDGNDGFVSLEVSPHLAHDTQGTIQEVKKYTELVDKPNLMVKVPATPEGIPAIEALTAEGYNINITLMFSIDQYNQVADAYMSGLEKLADKGGDLTDVHSVASIFVSRLDVKIDRIFDSMDHPLSQELKGKIGIANAKMVYQKYLESFQSSRWEALSGQGARVQRVLYGSTSTKNPAYPDTLYPDNLIGADTVNTLPPETLDAFLDHGTVAETLTEDIASAQEELDQLSTLGLKLDNLTKELLDEGVIKFANSFDELMLSIADKKAALK